VGLRWTSSARKHGVTREDAVHAIRNAVHAEWAASGVVVTTGRPYRMPYIAVITVGPEGITGYRDYWNLAVAAEALTPIDATGDAA
jgi:ketosteroid isomerase-like protein